MFAITVTEKGGDQRRLDFDKAEITIGRVQGNDIVLPKGNVSKRHARIVLKDGKFIIVDLKSTNGTYVNGRKITSPLVVKDSDKIYIGDFILGVEESGRATSVPPPPGLLTQPPPAPIAPQPGLSTASRPGPSAPPPLAEPSGPPLGSTSIPPPAPIESGRHAPSTSPPRPAPRSSQPPPIVGPSSAAPSPLSAAAAPMSAPSPVVPPLAPSVVPSPVTPPSVPAPVAAPTAPAAAPKHRLVGAGASAVRRARPMTSSTGASRAPVVAPLDPKLVKQLELQSSILDKLIPKLGIDELPLDRLGDEDLWQRAESAIADLVEDMESAGEIPKFVDQDRLVQDTLNEALGLGPLEDMLADEAVEEVIVDRRDRILMTREGQMTASGSAFSSDDVLRRVVERLVFPTGHTIDEGTPLVDVRLRDGSRLAAAVPPVAVRGACLTLRKPWHGGYDLDGLVAGGALTAAMASFLTTCVAARKNILVCGAPSSGKSAVLAALATAAPAGERIVSIEEVSELQINREDWIALESRPGDGNGLSSVDVESLLRGAMRMRPDRLVVGDVRGTEAFELIQAMVSSCDGTLASITGEGANASLMRLATLGHLLAGGASLNAVRDLVGEAVDIVVHVARYADGTMRVAAIEEVLGASDAGFRTQSLFSYRGSGNDDFAASGVVPGFYEELKARGMAADTSVFDL